MTATRLAHSSTASAPATRPRRCSSASSGLTAAGRASRGARHVRVPDKLDLLSPRRVRDQGMALRRHLLDPSGLRRLAGLGRRAIRWAIPRLCRRASSTCTGSSSPRSRSSPRSTQRPPRSHPAARAARADSDRRSSADYIAGMVPAQGAAPPRACCSRLLSLRVQRTLRRGQRNIHNRASRDDHQLRDRENRQDLQPLE